MEHFKRTVLPILLTGIWINLAATIKWMVLIQPYWIEKYSQMGLVFPESMMNNLVWMIWGFMFASVIYVLIRKFNLVQTTLLTWFMAYIMLWVIVWNVGVLPTAMLWINVPLSFLETLAGAWICRRVINWLTN